MFLEVPRISNNKIEPLRPAAVQEYNPGYMSRYKLAYVPFNFFGKYCKSGKCWGRYLDYIA